MEQSYVTTPQPQKTGRILKRYLLLALLESNLLHQSDKLGAVLVSNGHVTASGDELLHLTVTEKRRINQLLPEPELERVLVHVLHRLQQVHLETKTKKKQPSPGCF